MYLEAEIEHYWVREAPTGSTLSSYEVKVHDETRNTLVIESGDGPYVVVYDSNDQFNFLEEPETFESFKRNLEEGVMVDVRVQGHSRSATNFFERKQ